MHRVNERDSNQVRIEVWRHTVPPTHAPLHAPQAGTGRSTPARPCPLPPRCLPCGKSGRGRTGESAVPGSGRGPEFRGGLWRCVGCEISRGGATLRPGYFGLLRPILPEARAACRTARSTLSPGDGSMHESVSFRRDLRRRKSSGRDADVPPSARPRLLPVGHAGTRPLRGWATAGPLLLAEDRVRRRVGLPPPRRREGGHLLTS